MRRLKRWKGEPFGKQFEGVYWEKRKVMRKWDGKSDDGKKFFSVK